MAKLMHMGRELGGAVEKAVNLFFDNTKSKLKAKNVQAAVDELAEKTDELNNSLFSNYTSRNTIYRKTGIISDVEFVIPEDGFYVLYVEFGGTITDSSSGNYSLISSETNTYARVCFPFKAGTILHAKSTSSTGQIAVFKYL